MRFQFHHQHTLNIVSCDHRLQVRARTEGEDHVSQSVPLLTWIQKWCGTVCDGHAKWFKYRNVVSFILWLKDITSTLRDFYTYTPCTVVLNIICSALFYSTAKSFFPSREWWITGICTQQLVLLGSFYGRLTEELTEVPSYLSHPLCFHSCRGLLHLQKEEGTAVS